MLVIPIKDICRKVEEIAKELNISEDLFEYLLGTLQERNAVVKDAKERGVELIVADITDEYLESLLQ